MGLLGRADDLRESAAKLGREAKSSAKDAGGRLQQLFGDAKRGIRTRTSAKSVAAVGAAGAAGAFFLDPNEGKRRRDLIKGRIEGVVKKGTRRVRHASDNDQQLTERVKSEIFQPADAPKDSVNVNVEHGIVYLRGEIDDEGQLRKLVQQARSIDGVKGVESLLTS